jgi:hypothetical protein
MIGKVHRMIFLGAQIGQYPVAVKNEKNVAAYVTSASHM